MRRIALSLVVFAVASSGCTSAHLSPCDGCNTAADARLDAAALEDAGREASVDAGTLDTTAPSDAGAPDPRDATGGLDTTCAPWTPPDAPPLDAGVCGSCEAIGARCGSPIDGCGNRLSCGECVVTSARAAFEMFADIAYDAARDQVVATTRGMGSLLDPYLVGLDPASAGIAWTALAGGWSEGVVIEPAGRRAWVSTDFMTRLVDIDLETHERGLRTEIGPGRYGALRMPALTTLPSGAIVASGWDSMWPDELFPVVAVLDDHVMRPRRAMPPGWRAGHSLAAVDDGLVVGLDAHPPGGGPSVASFITIDSGGVVGATDVACLFAEGETSISFDGLYVVGSSGTVVEPRSRTLVGRAVPEGGGTLEGAVADRDANRLYAALSGGTGLVLVSFDLARLVEIGRVDLGLPPGLVLRILVRSGRGLVVLADTDPPTLGRRVIFVETNLMPE